MSTSGPHAPHGRRHVEPLVVSLTDVYTGGAAGEAGSRRRVHVARFHETAKPAFCWYRQGKLVMLKIWLGDSIPVPYHTKCDTNSKLRAVSGLTNYPHPFSSRGAFARRGLSPAGGSFLHVTASSKDRERKHDAAM